MGVKWCNSGGEIKFNANVKLDLRCTLKVLVKFVLPRAYIIKNQVEIGLSLDGRIEKVAIKWGILVEN